MPADNNVTENVTKQLNKKLRLMEGFESIESAERYVRLLVSCYRFKRFTDSCRKTNTEGHPWSSRVSTSPDATGSPS